MKKKFINKIALLASIGSVALQSAVIPDNGYIFIDPDYSVDFKISQEEITKKSLGSHYWKYNARSFGYDNWIKLTEDELNYYDSNYLGKPIFEIYNKINKNKDSLTYRILTFDTEFQSLTKNLINKELNYRENTDENNKIKLVNSIIELLPVLLGHIRNDPGFNFNEKAFIKEVKNNILYNFDDNNYSAGSSSDFITLNPEKNILIQPRSIAKYKSIKVIMKNGEVKELNIEEILSKIKQERFAATLAVSTSALIITYLIKIGAIAVITTGAAVYTFSTVNLIVLNIRYNNFSHNKKTHVFMDKKNFYWEYSLFMEYVEDIILNNKDINNYKFNDIYESPEYWYLSNLNDFFNNKNLNFSEKLISFTSIISDKNIYYKSKNLIIDYIIEKIVDKMIEESDTCPSFEKTEISKNIDKVFDFLDMAIKLIPFDKFEEETRNKIFSSNNNEVDVSDFKNEIENYENDEEEKRREVISDFFEIEKDLLKKMHNKNEENSIKESISNFCKNMQKSIIKNTISQTIQFINEISPNEGILDDRESQKYDFVNMLVDDKTNRFDKKYIYASLFNREYISDYIRLNKGRDIWLYYDSYNKNLRFYNNKDRSKILIFHNGTDESGKN